MATDDDTRSTRLHFRSPAGVVDELNAEAERVGRSRSNLILRLVCEALEVRRNRRRAGR